MFTRQPTITARLGVFAAEGAPTRVAILRRVHVEEGLAIARGHVLLDMRNVSLTSFEPAFSLSRRDVESWKSGSRWLHLEQVRIGTTKLHMAIPDDVHEYRHRPEEREDVYLGRRDDLQREGSVCRTRRDARGKYKDGPAQLWCEADMKVDLCGSQSRRSIRIDLYMEESTFAFWTKCGCDCGPYAWINRCVWANLKGMWTGEWTHRCLFASCHTDMFA